jgi:homoserine O-acetyltransferase
MAQERNQVRIISAEHTLENYTFENGDYLEQVRIAYKIFGDLQPKADNLLLVLPGTSNISESTLDHIGPGRAYDTDKYCVISTDAIGGGGSSKPSDGLFGRFPRYSIRDLVNLQVRFVREGLKIRDEPFAVLAGASMGAFQTLEWLINYPDTVSNAILLVPAWHANNAFKLATDRMNDFIHLDPNWSAGNYQNKPSAGLRAAGGHYFAWTVTDEYLETTDLAELRKQAQAAGDWFESWDAWDILLRYACSSSHDVTEPFDGDLQAALARINARCLILPCRQDRLLGIKGAQALAKGIKNAIYDEIDSITGHLAWRPRPGSDHTTFVTRTIRNFLSLP